MASDNSGAIAGIVIFTVVVVAIIALYFFLIKPAIDSITLWWDLGYGPWFLIGLFVGVIVAAFIAVYVASR
ncbi:MAG: hypothetical protein M1166_02465 [Candidatus Thermoplasmatota archaeon]|jgi:hypothetical protein|nr:hypothetical protein [Candidatus Thermoplasmatota archaeon]